MKTFYLLSLETLNLRSTTKVSNLEQAENKFAAKGYNIYDCIITDDISCNRPFRNIYY